MTAAMLDFDVRIELPLSALCEFGTPEIAGHRVKILYANVPSRRRQVCSKCKRDIVHDLSLGTYVTPFTIEEEPF